MPELPEAKTMSVRAFLRGGYKEFPNNPIIVVSGDTISMVVFPGMMAIELRALTVPQHGSYSVVQPGQAAPKPKARRTRFPDLTTRAR